MFHSHIRFIVSVVALLAVVGILSSPLAAQSTSNCAAAGGLEFCPQGQAKVVETEGGVEVSNLSLTGRDGATVDLTGGQEAVVDVSHTVALGETGLVTEGYLQFATRGPIEGTEGTIMRSTLWASRGSLYATTDFPGLPSARNFIAVVEDDTIIALYDDLDDGYSVRISPVESGLRLLSEERGVRNLSAPLGLPIPQFNLVSVCPVEATSETLWGLCVLIPCDNDDITFIDMGDPYLIDIINPQHEVIDNFETSIVIMGRDAANSVRRGPFTEQAITGAGFESFELEGSLAGGLAH